MNEWAVYLSLGQVDSKIRLNPTNVGSILVALLHVPRKYHLKGHQATTVVKQHQIHNREDLWKVFKHIFCRLDSLINTGELMLHVDGRMRQCHPASSAWMAAYFENTHLNPINQPHWAVCEEPTLLFGERYSSLWQLRGYQRYFHKMILVTQIDDMEGLEQDTVLTIEWLEPQKASWGR